MNTRYVTRNVTRVDVCTRIVGENSPPLEIIVTFRIFETFETFWRTGFERSRNDSGLDIVRRESTHLEPIAEHVSVNLNALSTMCSKRVDARSDIPREEVARDVVHGRASDLERLVEFASTVGA